MRTPVITFILFAAVVVFSTGFWPLLAKNILPTVTWGLYSKEFFEGFLGGAHGTLLDLFLVGIVLYWFERRSDRRQEVQRRRVERVSAIARHQEALVDLRFYSGADSSIRTFNTIKRLMELGVRDFSCPEARLDGIDIEGLYFDGANMTAAKFRGAVISKTKFINCRCDAGVFVDVTLTQVEFQQVNFSRAKFCHAQLSGVDFSNCKIERVDFSGANLRSAIFRGVDCKGVNFKDADLRSANFIGAKNITAEMLRDAKSTAYIQPASLR